MEIIEWITRQTWSNGQVHLAFSCLLAASISRQKGAPPGDSGMLPQALIQ